MGVIALFILKYMDTFGLIAPFRFPGVDYAPLLQPEHMEADEVAPELMVLLILLLSLAYW